MFFELVKTRRSIRNYSQREVEAEKIETIIEAALRAPSGRGLRPWHLVVVTDKTILEKLAVAKPQGAEFLKSASAAVVVCGDTQKSPLWIEGCTIAAVFMQLTAHALGLGSRWAHMRDNMYDATTSSRNYIATMLGLPDNLDVECVIALGYADEQLPPYKKEDLPFDQISYNSYDQK
jgi:nitroreductase